MEGEGRRESERDKGEGGFVDLINLSSLIRNR